jgi:hypothetical protein
VKKWLWVLWWIPPIGVIPISAAIDRLPTGDVKSVPCERMQPLLIYMALLYVVVVVIVRVALAESKPFKPLATNGFPVLPPKTGDSDNDSDQNAKI